MGTRADFYIGRGPDAKWLGSIAWDGYPEGVEEPLVLKLDNRTEAHWVECVTDMLKAREDASLPDRDGWPWPWSDSGNTDYAYAFDDGKVWASCFGGAWFDTSKPEPDQSEDVAPKVVFPCMKVQKPVHLGKRSGVIVFCMPEG